MKTTKTIKIAILGSSGVGKSSILMRFVNNQFDQKINSTFGAAFLDKTFEYGGITHKLQIWDTAGQEKYAPLASLYYRDADVVLLVYDITNEESFHSLKEWHKELIEKGPKNILIGLVGNKSDLHEREQVLPKEGIEYSKSIKAFFKQTSAKENKGILELFIQICEEVEKKDAAALANQPSTKTNTNKLKPETKTDTGCCLGN